VHEVIVPFIAGATRNQHMVANDAGGEEKGANIAEHAFCQSRGGSDELGVDLA
jgi:hypothetical protein